MYSRLKRNPGQDLAKCRYASQQQSLTLSCHRESGMFCLRSVHLGRLCVRFPPAAGSSAQPHSLRIAQNLHSSEAPTKPPLCSEYCLWKWQDFGGLYFWFEGPYLTHISRDPFTLALRLHSSCSRHLDKRFTRYITVLRKTYNIQSSHNK